MNMFIYLKWVFSIFFRKPRLKQSRLKLSHRVDSNRYPQHKFKFSMPTDCPPEVNFEEKKTADDNKSMTNLPSMQRVNGVVA